MLPFEKALLPDGSCMPPKHRMRLLERLVHWKFVLSSLFMQVKGGRMLSCFCSPLGIMSVDLIAGLRMSKMKFVICRDRGRQFDQVKHFILIDDSTMTGVFQMGVSVCFGLSRSSESKHQKPKVSSRYLLSRSASLFVVWHLAVTPTFDPSPPQHKHKNTLALQIS